MKKTLKHRSRFLVCWQLLGLCITHTSFAQEQTPELRITEVVTGLYANPSVQYIVLRVQIPGITDLSSYTLEILDGSNLPKGQVSLEGTLLNTSQGSPVLIANAAAENFFNIKADFPGFPGTIYANYQICLIQSGQPPVVVDCFVFGGIPNSLQTGNLPFSPNGGMILGQVGERFGYTGHSAADFRLLNVPWPENNLGVIGTISASTCGNGTIEGFEACDNGSQNGVAGNACASNCQFTPIHAAATCGNGSVEVPEQCDDGNLVNGDGCSAFCRLETLLPITLVPQAVCGNHILEISEQCDDGNTSNGDGCSSSCQTEAAYQATCGNGVVDPNEQCDNGQQNGSSHACGSNCRATNIYFTGTLCGNRVVDPNEQCDDGNTHSGDGCSAFCQLELPTYYTCGNGIIDYPEACDNGAQNGTTLNTCTSTCQWVNPPTNPILPSSTTGLVTTTGGIVTGTTTGSTTGGNGTGSGTGGGTGSASTSTGATSGASSTTGNTGNQVSTSVPKNVSCQAVTMGDMWPFSAWLAWYLAIRRRKKTPQKCSFT